MNGSHIDELTPRDDGDRRFRALDPPPPAGPTITPLPDSRLLVAHREGSPIARASIRVAEDLAGAPGRTGIIGHYEAREGDAGITLLRAAVDRLADAGVDRVIGPMDGTTWDRYRLAIPTPTPGERPPFLTEPVNPPEYPSHFEAAGMDVTEWYVSQLVDDLGALADRVRDPATALAERGVRVDALEPSRFEGVLEELFAVSLEAFAGNPYYSPIGFDRFRAMYAPLRDLLDPDLVLVARHSGGEAAGFVLSFPDLLDPAGRPTRIIVKSLAVATSARGLGLGSLLVHETHRRAAAKGYRAAIHALMHAGNDSLKISSHGGSIFRHYALYGWSP